MPAPLAYCMWPSRGWTLATSIRLLIGLSLACSGVGAFVLYLGLKFNAPFAFASLQNNAWNRGTHRSLTEVVSYAAGRFAQMHLLGGFPLPSTLDPWIFVTFAAVIFYLRSQLSTDELPFAGATFGLLTVTRLFEGHAFGSMNRYMLPVFPAYIAIAKLVDRRPLLMVGLCVWMAVGLFWYSALFESAENLDRRSPVHDRSILINLSPRSACTV